LFALYNHAGPMILKKRKCGSHHAASRVMALFFACWKVYSEHGDVLEGSLPVNKMKLVTAWAEIHREDLLANWNLAVKGQPTAPIKPLE
jgi:hypothetical protein